MMLMKRGFLASFCICTLRYIVCQTSGINYCQPEETGYQDCKAKKAVCHTNGQSYFCECPPGLQFGKGGNDECEVIDMCGNDSPGYRYCESDLALCRNDPSKTEGFDCYCAEGKVKIGGLCKDASDTEISTDPTADSTSSSLLSSSVLSSSGTENTSFETFNDSSKSDITYLFTTSQPSSIHSPSTSDLPALTTSNDYDRSTTIISVVPDTNECARHQCSQNATCIKLAHGFTCQCKVGFVPHKKFSSTKSHCLRNCTLEGCEDTCKEVKCILKEEEERIANVSTCAYFENKYSGWSTDAIIVCSVLTLVVFVFVASTIFLHHRYKKLRKMREFEDKQIVYRKMDKGSLCSESKDNLVIKGISYI